MVSIEQAVAQAREQGKRAWAPQPRQAQFLTARADEVLYGGAAFGGKSEALLMYSVRRRQKWPGSAGLILRRTFADLSKPGALIDRSHQLLEGTDATWHGTEHRWTWPNGSILQFGYLDNPQDRYHYQGQQYSDICWDELTQFSSEDDYQFVNAFCRTNIPGCPPRIRAATNPGGPGHAWVKQRFVDVVPAGEIYTESGRTRLFLPATLDDNPIGIAMNPNYEKHLESLPPAMARALRYGDWDTFEGQVFGEWRRQLHVCKPFRIPDDWTRWAAIDYGYSAPMCCLWFARTPDGERLFIYRELYGTGWRAKEQAQRILVLDRREKIAAHLADPSMFAKRHETVGDSIADEYQAAGIILSKANNNRIAGVNAIHSALAWREGPEGQVVSYPRLQVFDTCINLIRTLPALPSDSFNPEDMDTSAEDHAADALKYGLLADRAVQRRQQGIQPVTLPIETSWTAKMHGRA